ncbi:MAG: hypothetical protein KTQ13_06305 [Ferruginibacter sp.]|nr:hypothetical protein [Ferruginibacter sp.]MBU9936246.1 hypothetical protein [Ferruginibacter sp.]HQY11780.1 hypothetical protein [Ferruginibacter sp.]
MADEEKGPEKTDLEKKSAKKDYLACFSHVSQDSVLLKKRYHISEDIQLSPAPEKPTPPPNFC